MQWVKIQIPDRAESAKALMEMTRHGRIDYYGDNTYVVPEPALQLLADLGITYREIERFGRDRAEKMLRDTLAAHAQRRHAGQPGDAPAGVG
jgi:hypothetical protein